MLHSVCFTTNEIGKKKGKGKAEHVVEGERNSRVQQRSYGPEGKWI